MIQYIIFSQGGASHTWFTATNQTITALDVSLFDKFQSWHSVNWVKYCTTPYVIAGITPLNYFDSLNILYVYRWLAGRRNE